MKKLFAVDLRRLLHNRIVILTAIAAPLILVLLVSLVVAPYFFSDVRARNFFVVVYNEDDNEVTKGILESLVESESLGGLITVEFVDSEEDGLAAIDNGAAAYIHVPLGMQDILYGGSSTVITYVGNPDMPLEDRLLFETLSSGTALVSHAQHAVNVLYDKSVDAGVGRQTASEAYRRTALTFFAEVMSRDELYEETEETSPLGGALPSEYYAASFLILFVALGALPVARITAADHGSGLIHRQLLSGHRTAACFVSRWLAGGAFALMQYIVLAAALGIIAGVRFSVGGAAVLLMNGALLCAFISLGMMLIGLYARTASAAVRIAFLAVLALALMGGLMVPSAYMPAFIRDVSYYTPMSAALRLGIYGISGGRAGGVGLFAGTLAVFIAVLLPVSIGRFQRRIH